MRFGGIHGFASSGYPEFALYQPSKYNITYAGWKKQIKMAEKAHEI